MVARRVKRLSILENMKKSILGLMALCLWSCGDSDSFSTCQETTVAGLRELSSQVQNSSFCRTIYGEVSFQYSGRCARKGCFFLYDVDAQGNRVKGDSIYLSDVSAFPAKWQRHTWRRCRRCRRSGHRGNSPPDAPYTTLR